MMVDELREMLIKNPKNDYFGQYFCALFFLYAYFPMRSSFNMMHRVAAHVECTKSVIHAVLFQ